ncbi:MAG: prepilin-type N-terminal cleavage/methylation domain-containing protein [Planctomycetota bacterium]
MTRSKRSAGFGLLELVVTLTILSLTLLTAAEALVSTIRTQSTASVREVLDEQVRRTLARLGDVLRQAGESTLLDVPDGPSTNGTMRFRLLRSYDPDSGPQWSPIGRLFLKLAPGEVANGTDDDGDGRIDEGALMFQVGGQTSQWCANVVEFTVSRYGRRLQLVLTCSARGAGGSMIEVRRTGHVTLRN